MHKEIAEKVLELLKNEFPTASLALAGSVASGKYTKDSDIDIIFVSNDFCNSHVLNFYINKIKIGVFILNNNIIQQNIFTLQSHHIAHATLISQSITYNDPDNKIKDITSRIKELYEKRELVNSLLINEIKKKILVLFTTKQTSFFEKRINYLEIINNIQNIFFLKKLNRLTTKQEGHNPFSVIKEIDKFMYDALLNCIPFNENSLPDLQEFYFTYFINHY